MATEHIVPDKEKPKQEDEGKFGYLGFTPSWLQWLNNPWAFLFGVAGLSFGQALSVIGLLAIIMPQIEKRFNFSSSDIGMIAASNDVAAVVLGLFISHYGNFGNKVKWIGLGGVVTGAGLFIFTLPHYIIEKYNPPPVSYPALLCLPQLGNITKPENCDEGNIAEWYYLAIFLVGQFVAGVGSITLYSFAPAVFQECASEKNVPLFLGLWQFAIFTGPLVAFAISEPLLELYVDIKQPEGLNINPKDPRWIGNWWVGILAATFLTILSSLFILGFPRNIKRQKGKALTSQDTTLTPKEKMSALPAALKRLLTNWTFIFNSMGTNCILLYGEGLAPFVAKILVLRFGVAPEKVGNALTLSVVPPMIIGILVGSFSTRAFKLENSGRKSAFMCFIVQIFVIIGPMAFLLPGCNDVNLAGWNEPYGKRSGLGEPYNFTEYPTIPGVPLGSTCNSNCGCDLGIALPVCGSDNITYLSPCYAGCTGLKSMTTFANCSCVSSKNDFGGTVTIGFCDQKCKNWVAFLALMGIVSLAIFLQITPSKFVLMRCINPEDLSFAFGLQYLSTKVFSHIPGPIIFGYVVDLNCVIWQKVCEKTGYCWIYDMDAQMKMVTMITGILAGLGIICFMLSWLLYVEADYAQCEEEGTMLKINIDEYEASPETKL